MIDSIVKKDRKTPKPNKSTNSMNSMYMMKGGYKLMNYMPPFYQS
jgi:hypothetical protein